MPQQPVPKDRAFSGPNTPAEERELLVARDDDDDDDDDDDEGRRRCRCRFAVVARDGTLIRGKGARRATRLAGGQYEVIFNRNVLNCAYVATIGDIDSAGVESPGEITTVGRLGRRNGVFVTTHNSQGAYEDRSFHLFVACP